MSQKLKWNAFRLVAAVISLAMLGAVSCGPQGGEGGGDETAKKYKGSGPCG